MWTALKVRIACVVILKITVFNIIIYAYCVCLIVFDISVFILNITTIFIFSPQIIQENAVNYIDPYIIFLPTCKPLRTPGMFSMLKTTEILNISMIWNLHVFTTPLLEKICGENMQELCFVYQSDNL